MNTDTSAFEYFQQLSQKADQKHKREEVEPANEILLGICFGIENIAFVTEVTNLEAVIQPDKIYPFPVEQDGYWGLSTYQGILFSVLDLKYILNQARTIQNPEAKILIYRYHQAYIGFLVEKCLGLKSFDLSEKQSLPLKSGLFKKGFVHYSLYKEKTPWAVLEIFDLINHIHEGGVLGTFLVSG